MISLKYIKEAIRLNLIKEQDAQTYSDWQWNMYMAAQEAKKSRMEAKPLPDYLNHYRKASVDCACTWCGLAKEELAKRNIKQAS